MNYKEFVAYAVETLCDAVITGGFKGLKSAFEYQVMNVLWMNRATIWPGEIK